MPKNSFTGFTNIWKICNFFLNDFEAILRHFLFFPLKDQKYFVEGGGVTSEKIKVSKNA